MEKTLSELLADDRAAREAKGKAMNETNEIITRGQAARTPAEFLSDSIATVEESIEMVKNFCPWLAEDIEAAINAGASKEDRRRWLHSLACWMELDEFMN